ncbi:MAG: outer membrane protein assembly factor BamD [Alphaproteobacteria bacterium]
MTRLVSASLSLWLRRILLPMAVVATIAACSGKDQKDAYIEGTVEELYNAGQDNLLQEKYKDAAKFFEEVDRQHPFSVWATRAQLMAGFAYYKDRNYDAAIVSVDRFIRLHPSHRDIAYAYYLKGLAHFDQVRDVKRDTSSALRAQETFDELVKRFPNTQYTRDAQQKIDLLKDHMAGSEMYIGRYYQSRGLYLGAINRYRTIVDKYQTTSMVPEALHRLAECYTALGLKDEAQRTAAVLGYNYPASEWYIESYELVENKPVVRPPSVDPRTFWQRTWEWLF